MSVVKFYSDPHFGHELVSVLRGFKSIEEHDEYLVDQWNANTSKRDVIWLLGDLTMGKKNNYYMLDRLNGQKRIILGNHDYGNHVRSLLANTTSILSVAGIVKTKIQGVNMFLSHVPVHPMEFNYRVGLNIHGHLHDNRVFTNADRRFPTQVDPRYVCVSAEQIDFKPISFEEIKEKEKNLDPIEEYDRLLKVQENLQKLKDEKFPRKTRI